MHNRDKKWIVIENECVLLCLCTRMRINLDDFVFQRKYRATWGRKEHDSVEEKREAMGPGRWKVRINQWFGGGGGILLWFMMVWNSNANEIHQTWSISASIHFLRWASRIKDYMWQSYRNSSATFSPSWSIGLNRSQFQYSNAVVWVFHWIVCNKIVLFLLSIKYWFQSI